MPTPLCCPFIRFDFTNFMVPTLLIYTRSLVLHWLRFGSTFVWDTTFVPHLYCPTHSSTPRFPVPHVRCLVPSHSRCGPTYSHVPSSQFTASRLGHVYRLRLRILHTFTTLYPGFSYDTGYPHGSLVLAILVALVPCGHTCDVSLRRHHLVCGSFATRNSLSFGSRLSAHARGTPGSPWTRAGSRLQRVCAARFISRALSSCISRVCAAS